MTRALINSMLALSAAFLFTIILHESAHYLMYQVLGLDATLYHNRVMPLAPLEDKGDEVLIAGIGPLFSLLLGIITYLIASRIRNGPLSLFTLWLGINGILVFFGYLMIAPIMPVGDTGRIFALFDVPVWIQIVVAIVAVISLILFLTRSSSRFEKYASKDFGTISLNRKKWSMTLILFPLIGSVVVVTVLQFPVVHFISILATVCTPWANMAIFGAFIGNQTPINRGAPDMSVNDSISILLVLLFIVSLAANRILVGGV